MSDSRLQRYTVFFEQLSPNALTELASVMTEDVHFVDPFNDVQGLEAVRKVFLHMFDSLENPRFTVTHAAVSDGPSTRGMIRWEMTSQLKGRSYNIIGMSEIGFAADGRVCEHIDHWDAGAQFYERLPLLGSVLRLIRSRLQV
jgi:steroid delta-isomerase